MGSLVLIDSIISNTPTAIVTSLFAENSTSFLLQNVVFFNVQRGVIDSFQNNRVLLPGADVLLTKSWGFGMINNASSGMTTFVNGQNIPTMNRKRALINNWLYEHMDPYFFTRRRPTYYDVPTSKIMDVKALGAKGDGVTDDTAALNSILEGAANTSSIAYFPFGIYLIKDTLRVPVGSRIIGQAWSQIMATGPNFGNELLPRPAVQVGKRGDAGIVEIQDLLFTVKGATAGAILVEWNVRESSQGSAGIWGEPSFRPYLIRETLTLIRRFSRPCGRRQGV